MWEERRERTKKERKDSWGCKDQDDSDGDVLAAVGSSTSNVSKLWWCGEQGKPPNRIAISPAALRFGAWL